MLSEETSYDANGNIVLLPMMRMSYDVQNRMVRMQSVDGTERYGYNHENLRVWVQAADGSESIAFYLGTQNLATYSLKRDAQGNLVFQLGQSNIYFGKPPSADQRRGDRGRPAGQRARLERQEGAGKADFMPFGEKVQAASDDDLSSFDGYKRAPSGLDYAQQRYYSSALGRFVSPDPYEKSAHPDSPDSWNRYAFVSNDPINRTDPTASTTATTATTATTTPTTITCGHMLYRRYADQCSAARVTGNPTESYTVSTYDPVLRTQPIESVQCRYSSGKFSGSSSSSSAAASQSGPMETENATLTDLISDDSGDDGITGGANGMQSLYPIYQADDSGEPDIMACRISMTTASIRSMK